MVLWQVADMITELKLGNGTSILITANIASALPASVGAAVQQAADKDSSALPIYALAFFLTTLGIVYVQEVRASLCSNTDDQLRVLGIVDSHPHAQQAAADGCAVCPCLPCVLLVFGAQ